MMYNFVKASKNVKVGKIPVTYTERKSCPTSCPHYQNDCYAEAFHTSMAWGKVNKTIDMICESISKLKKGTLWRHNVAGDLPGINESVDMDSFMKIVNANKIAGARGYTYTHKKSAEAIEAARIANDNGFVVNMSADDAGEADILAKTGLPTVVVVPMDTPQTSYTPEGRRIVVCPAQTHETVTCKSCKLCAVSHRPMIIGFRAHGFRAKIADKISRKTIPITLVK